MLIERLAGFPLRCCSHWEWESLIREEDCVLLKAEYAFPKYFVVPRYIAETVDQVACYTELSLKSLEISDVNSTTMFLKDSCTTVVQKESYGAGTCAEDGLSA